MAKGATCGSAAKGIAGFANAAMGPDGQPLTQLSGTNCAAQAAHTSDSGTARRDALVAQIDACSRFFLDQTLVSCVDYLDHD